MLFQLGQGYQNVFDKICDCLDDKDLANFSKVDRACADIVKQYDLSGRVSKIFAIPRDFLERICSFYDSLSQELQTSNLTKIEKTKKNLALSTDPRVVLNRLTQLPNSPSRQTLLLNASHIILDPKIKYWYFRVNRMCFSVLNTINKIITTAMENNPNVDPTEVLTPYITELSKKKDQKRIPNSCIEDVTYSRLLSSEGMPPPRVEEAIRQLIQFEIGKIEPVGDKNFDQTIEEFAEVLEQTFKDVKPLYDILINLVKELKPAQKV